MSAQDMCNTAEAFDLCRELPQWINRHRPDDGYRRYRAQELDYSFNGLPTLTVEVSGAQGRIAAYKSNIALIPGERNPWLVFSPLVVVWEKSKEERGPGLGRPIVDHSVSSIAAYCEAHARHIPNILLASGKLTEAKAGRPFFEALGWEIASSGDCGLLAGDACLAMCDLHRSADRRGHCPAPAEHAGGGRPHILCHAPAAAARQPSRARRTRAGANLWRLSRDGILRSRPGEPAMRRPSGLARAFHARASACYSFRIGK